jgi:hypothetical protein
MCRVETPSLGGSDMSMLALIHALGKGQVYEIHLLLDKFSEPSNINA